MLVAGKFAWVPHVKIPVKCPLYSSKFTFASRQFACILHEVLAASTHVNLPVFTGKLYVTQVKCLWGLFTCELHVKLPAFVSNFARVSFTAYCHRNDTSRHTLIYHGRVLECRHISSVVLTSFIIFCLQRVLGDISYTVPNIYPSWACLSSLYVAWTWTEKVFSKSKFRNLAWNHTNIAWNLKSYKNVRLISKNCHATWENLPWTSEIRSAKKKDLFQRTAHESWKKISRSLILANYKTTGAVALQYFPFMWCTKNWRSIQLNVFTINPISTKNISM